MVILYNPTSSQQKKPVLPMSLLALGSLLEGLSDYRFVDGNLEQDPLESLSREITASGARLLGVTVMPGPQLNEAVPLCHQLKARFPDLPIVWGGYFPTQHFDTVLQSPSIDFVIRGHGEYSFRELVRRLDRSEAVDDLAGLAYRDPESGDIVSNPLPALPEPDELPDYPYHRIPMYRYVRNTFLGRTLSHHSSYGCPFTCNFCAVVNMVSGRWKAQSAGRTANTVKLMVTNWNASGIEFMDNNFFVNEARVVEYSERIVPYNINWWGEARIDTLLRFNESSWSTMARSGLKMVFLGAESGSNRTLELMNKGGTATVDKTLEIAAKTAQYGIVPEFSFVLGNPPDPEADAEETLTFIRRVKQVNPRSEIILYLYTPVPLASSLFDQVREDGFQFPQTLDEWVTRNEWRAFSMRRSRKLPWLDASLVQKVRNFERVLNAYFPTSTNPKLGGVRRLLLRLAGGWRYHLGMNVFPIELRLLHKIFQYQRPETSGF